MSSTNHIFAAGQHLSMSVDSWQMYRDTPNWMRERMMAVNHFTDQSGDFEIAEVLLSEAIDDGETSDEHLLSLLVNSAAKHPLELDMGAGKYRRPNQPGNLVFTSSETASEIKGKGPFHSITFYISREKLLHRASRLLGHDSISLDVLHTNYFRDEAIEILMKRLLHQYQTTPIAGQRMTADDLVDDIVRRLLVLSEHMLPRTSNKESLRPASIERVVEYIHAHFGDDVSRDDLAKVAGVDPCHFTRLFRQTMGQTPKRYLLEVRIDGAKQLLKHRDELTLSEIAAQCGFYNQSHFGREFRRQVGITPNLFRTYS